MTSEVSLRKAIDAMFGEVMIVDRDFKMLEVNQYILDNYGISREDATGSYCYSVTHGLDKPCQPPKHECPVIQVFKTGKKAEVVHKHKDKDGNPLYEELIASPIFDEDGQVIKVLKISRDITEKKMADEKYQRLFNNANDLIWMADMEGNTYEINSKMIELTGYEKDELMGKSFGILIHPKSQEKAQEMYKRTIMGKSVSEGELVLITKDGREIIVEMNTTPIQFGRKVYGAQAIARDISEKKASQKKLKEYSLHLEDMVAVKTEEVEAQNEELTSMNEELTAMNEELITSNEELVISKEALEDSQAKVKFQNEEVTAMNEELTAMNEELSAMNDDLILSKEALEKSQQQLEVYSKELEKKVDERTSEIKQAKLFYQDILDGIWTGVYFCDAEDKLKFANKAMEHISSMDRDMIQGKDCFGLLKEENMEKIFSGIFKRAKTTKKAVPYDSYKAIKNNGEYSYQRGVVIPQMDENGEYNGMIVTVEDITEMVKAKEELQRRVKELDEFYDMAVGRELKMVELKKKIEMLEHGLGNPSRCQGHKKFK